MRAYNFFFFFKQKTAYEIAHIVQSGLERMYGGTHPDPNVMYYITVYNEPMPQPAEPEGLDLDGVIRGMYLLKRAENQGPKAQLLASGVAVPWALEAQRMLAEDWGVSADVWSVTSWSELRRDGLAAEQSYFVNPDAPARQAYVTERLAGTQGPVLAVND